VPVWHATTKELVENGELVVVAIASEQHRERTALWADWQAIDWPILWDPFNLTGSLAVPNAILVDASGIVVATGVRPDGLAEALEGLEPATVIDTLEIPPPQLAQLDRLAADDPERPLFEALSRCLWSGAAPTEADLEILRAVASGDERRGDQVFWSGVAERLAYDAAGGRGPGFARAIAAWQDAYALVPNQYIWRRRIQQYGPRLDQPYDFYAWIPEAVGAVYPDAPWRPASAQALTPTELALAAVETDERTEVPEGTTLLTDWDASTVAVEIVVVRGTSPRAEVESVCVHVALHDLMNTSRSVGGLGIRDSLASSVLIDGRAAALATSGWGEVDALRYTQDIPLARWEDDQPLPARLTYWFDVPNTKPRSIERWVDLKALARR
jgi:hypothetical protein